MITNVPFANKKFLRMVLFFLLPFLLVLILLVYYLIINKLEYWNKRHVPHLEPSFLYGNYKDFILMKKYAAFIAQDICRKFPNEPYIGTYYGTEPALLVQDPDTIKLILSKEFYYFSGREISKYCKHETISKSMFLSGGDDWKILRQNLTPLFSSAKLKNMFYLIQNCRETFEEVLRKETAESQLVEAKGLATRYTMDCIGSCVFGINTEVMTNNVKTNIFAVIGAEIFNTSIFRGIKMVVRTIWPSIFYGLRFQLFAPEIQNFFKGTLTTVFRSRQYQATSRHDFIDLILSWKNKSYLTGTTMSPNTENRTTISLEVNDDILVAQCVMLFAAGFETSSSALSLCLFELAKHKDAQDKVIQEIDNYFDKIDGKIEYGCINDLPYLQACLDETMRLYPVLGILTRETMHDYTLPTGLHLKKGVRIHIPVYHLHHDSQYYPDPEKFMPERFYGDEKERITPFTYLPFGEGPRICIGMRFSKMQIIPALLTIFKEYEIELMEGMKTTLDFAPGGLVSQTVNDLHLKFLKRNKQ